MKSQLNLVTVAIVASLSITATQAYADDVMIADNDETITVIGNRLEQAIDDVSGSVTVINAKEIESIQAKDIGDLLDYTPGVDVDKDPRYGIKSINIRGLEGNYVKIKVDNVDAPAEFSSGSLITSSRIDLDIDMIKTVEITRGPASTSQGSDAIGGLVLFQTKSASDFIDGEEGFGGHVKVLYDDKTSGFRHSVALAHRSGQFDTVLSYSQADFDGADDYHKLYQENSKPKSALFKTTYFFENDDFIRFSIDWNETDNFTDPVNETDEKFEYTEDTSERIRYGVQYVGAIKTALADEVALQLDWQEKDQDSGTYRWKGPNRFNPNAAPFGELKDYAYNEKGYSFDLQLNKQITVGEVEHNIAYGATVKNTDYSNVNITRDDSDFDGEYDDFTELFYYIPSSEADSLGVYFLDEISLFGGNLLITPGVRYDKFEQDPFSIDPTQGDIDYTGFSPTNSYEEYSESETTFKLGAVYRLSDVARVFAQYSQGFKAPDFSQLYYSWSNDRHGYKFQPNPNLKAETSDSYELGVRYNGDIVTFEASAFRSDFEDFIETTTDYSDPSYPYGIYKNENLADAEIKGYEFSSTISGDSILAGSWASVAFSYSDGEDGDGKTLSSVAPWSASANFSYDSPSDLWGTSLRVKHYSGADESDFEEGTQVVTGSATVLDLTAYLQITDEFVIRAGIFNLTDKKWYRWGNIKGVAPDAELDLYAEAKRSFTLTAKYDF